jgi:hypothetical protein
MVESAPEPGESSGMKSGDKRGAPTTLSYEVPATDRASVFGTILLGWAGFFATIPNAVVGLMAAGLVAFAASEIGSNNFANWAISIAFLGWLAVAIFVGGLGASRAKRATRCAFGIGFAVGNALLATYFAMFVYDSWRVGWQL